MKETIICDNINALHYEGTGTKKGKLEDLIIFVADRKGHKQRYAIYTSKANRELRWNLTTMFERGRKLTIQRYKDYTDWLDERTSGEYMNYDEHMYACNLNFW